MRAKIRELSSIRAAPDPRAYYGAGNNSSGGGSGRKTAATRREATPTPFASRSARLSARRASGSGGGLADSGSTNPRQAVFEVDERDCGTQQPAVFRLNLWFTSLTRVNAAGGPCQASTRCRRLSFTEREKRAARKWVARGESARVLTL